MENKNFSKENRQFKMFQRIYIPTIRPYYFFALADSRPNNFDEVSKQIYSWEMSKQIYSHTNYNVHNYSNVFYTFKHMTLDKL